MYKVVISSWKSQQVNNSFFPYTCSFFYKTTPVLLVYEWKPPNPIASKYRLVDPRAAYVEFVENAHRE